jgi:hypothetical protein
VKKLFAIITGAAFFWSCIGAEPVINSPAEKAPSGAASAPAVRSGPAADGLETPQFKGIPEEARVYLKKVAEAFRSRDGAFLAAQGSPQYEADNRGRYDEETYLAMLFRIGSYSEDLPWKPQALPRLEYNEIIGIEYKNWNDNGPHLEVRANLIPKTGEPIPCEIVLIWKLPDPKIEGVYP